MKIIERFVWVHAIGDRNAQLIDGSETAPYPLKREVFLARLDPEEEQALGRHLYKRVKVTIETVE